MQIHQGDVVRLVSSLVFDGLFVVGEIDAKNEAILKRQDGPSVTDSDGNPIRFPVRKLWKDGTGIE